ncbi:HDIG domain-containing metalloprotein [Desulfovibrio inopinatus]|uniref:HDIG domain-containing metalloprotein n=1 Tax=Desulfovibrio inopinatus TaxID=102109 RepID=UPI0004270BC9|nr:HDIG domain-containing metalloprotein [Desulfovibrio inopinatus]
MLSREDAWELLLSNNPEPHMLAHARQTEVVMAALAEKLRQDTALWSITGLLHDLDYPQTKENPERHGLDAAEMLAGKLPDEAITAIKAHNAEMTGVPAQSNFDFALRCGETVTGLINAAALVRPTRMDGMKAKSLKKKMKDKSFAASVSRANILECEKLGIDTGEFLTLAISAITPIAGEVGLSAE